MIELVLSTKIKAGFSRRNPASWIYGVGEKIGVNVGTGVRGVLVGRRVTVGVTRFTGICNCCPTWIALGSFKLLAVTMASVVLLNFEAMPASVSPGCTA